MQYPDTPFINNFNSRLITGLNEDNCDIRISNEQYEKTLKWLGSPPKITSYRVNTLKTNSEEVLARIQKHISEVLGSSFQVKVEIPAIIPNVVIIHSYFKEGFDRYDKEIIVDVDCAAAVLRGAHVYAPGVLAMMSGTKIDDSVSIYADSKKEMQERDAKDLRR
ncbi:hypothetical protein NQ315_013091 [Exocentrus adspersus]|uniref:Uncharacterized protein n=1 Tax=Exocentrus adspersus TaxID=1586481 RepID=A0AAV8VW32_9CUCU|nr:hypothetical protein NQ315_013091 [Exocentrus adspersus]